MTKDEALQEVQALSKGVTHDAAQLLDLLGTGAVQLPIEGTDKCVMAGTLKGILSMAGKMMGEDGVTGLKGLTRYGLVTWSANVRPTEAGDYVKLADVERLLAAPAAVSQHTGDLTDEQLRGTAGYRLGWMEGMQEGAELATAGEKTADDVEAEFADLLPGSYYMDPPDGGSPSVLEQVSRMAEDAAQWRAHLARHPKAEQPQGALDALGTTIKAVVNMLPAKEAGALIAAFGEVAHLARQAQAEPIAYVNRDELDNMLDDRTATIQTSQSNWRRTPLYAAPVAPAGAQNAEAIRNQAQVENVRSAPEPLNGIPATHRHDEGAIARCSYCGRYSLDPTTLSDRQPFCECGKQHGWCGSFKRPSPDAKWSGKAPALQTGSANTQEGGV